MSLLKSLKKELPDLSGNLNIKLINEIVFINGNLYTQNVDKLNQLLDDFINKTYPNRLITSSLKANDLVVSIDDNIVESNNNDEQILDEVKILYIGEMSIDFIVPTNKFKIVNKNNQRKIDGSIKVLGFIAPIILNSKLEVIDGNMRLSMAKDNGMKQVPVVIIDDNGIKSDFLRLALNRSSEFQRWNFYEVDDYVDNTPQAQPILMPIGFFGRKVLPTEYFTNTVVDYVIDPFNAQQKQYQQEYGLAEWAKIRREEMQKEYELRTKKKEKKKNAISLFDLTPTESDFVETYDPEEEIQKHNEKWKNKAEEINDKYQSERKEYYEKNNKPYQIKLRKTKEVAKDNREKAIENILENNELTNEQKQFVIGNIDDFADVYQSIDKLIQELKKYNI